MDYLVFLQNFRDVSHHIFDHFFLNVTMFGEELIPILIICLLYWVINKKIGVYILWSYLFGYVVNTLAKVTACIYRPWILDSRIHPLPQAIPAATGYSFPSGHTAGAATTWGGLAYAYWNNKLLRYLSIFIILAVMFSRNYLGVHTPQDVIVSFLISIVVLYLAKVAIDYSKSGKNHDLYIVGIVFFVTIATLIYLNIKYYPVHYLFGKILYSPDYIKINSISKSGFLFGSFIGWFIENRYIDFNPTVGTIPKKVIRYALGLLGLALLLWGLLPMMHHIYSRFIIFFISGAFVTCIYPYMVKKLNI